MTPTTVNIQGSSIPRPSMISLLFGRRKNFFRRSGMVFDKIGLVFVAIVYQKWENNRRDRLTY
jgi:hypothetical protein